MRITCLKRTGEQNARGSVYSACFVCLMVEVLIFMGVNTVLGQNRAADLNALYPVTINWNQVLVDRTGEIKLRTSALSVSSFRDECDCAWAMSQDQKWGVINGYGEWIVKPHYSLRPEYGDGLTLVNDDEASRKYRFVNMRGEFVFGGYDKAWGFREGRAAVRIDDKWGFVDTSGEMVIPLIYDDASSFSDGLALVQLGESKIYIRPDGTQAFIIESDVSVGGFSEGRAAFRKGGSEGIIDKVGKVVLPPTYREINEFSDGLAAFESDKGFWGYLDTEGRVVIPPTLMQVLDFSDGFAAVKTKGKWGYIDKSGQFKIPARYVEEPGNFYKGLANVGNLDIGVVFIDKKGRVKFTQADINRRARSANTASQGDSTH